MNPAQFWSNFIKNLKHQLHQLDDDLTYAPLNSILTEDENTSQWYIPEGLGRVKHNINILNNRAINRGRDQAKIDIIRNLQSLGVPYTSAYIAADAAVQGNYNYYQKLLSKYSSNNANDTNAINTSEGKLGLPITGMYDESTVNTETNANSDANKPLPPIATDEGEIPPGTVEVGPDTEKPVDKPTLGSVVKPKKVANTPVQSAKLLKRAPKLGVVSDTPVVNTPNVSTPNVAAPTLSSVTQAVRHNGGFDNYRRQSVLSALRAAGGISPAEAVQRGIIPMEALNYI
jgi:hypothetical protein